MIAFARLILKVLPLARFISKLFESADIYRDCFLNSEIPKVDLFHLLVYYQQQLVARIKFLLSKAFKQYCQIWYRWLNLGWTKIAKILPFSRLKVWKTIPLLWKSPPWFCHWDKQNKMISGWTNWVWTASRGQKIQRTCRIETMTKHHTCKRRKLHFEIQQRQKYYNKKLKCHSNVSLLTGNRQKHNLLGCEVHFLRW